MESLKAFLWTSGTSRIKDSRISKTIRGKRCLVWITHKNTPSSRCDFWDNMGKIHKDLTFGNLQRLGRIVLENGDARETYSVIFELKKK